MSNNVKNSIIRDMRRSVPIIISFILFFGSSACQRQPLDQRLISDDLKTRAKAMKKLVRMSDKKKAEVVPLLIQRFKDPDSRLVDRARRAIVAAGSIAVEPLAQTLKDPDVYARLSAAAALGQMGPDAVPAVDPLIEALKDSHPLIRGESAHALGEIGEPAQAATPALTEIAKKDKDEDVRATAAEALKKLGA